MAQSLFMTLQQDDPDCSIDVLAPAWSVSLLERMPQVHNALNMPLGHGALGLRFRMALGRQLQAVGYDQAILLPNSWKSALIPFVARIPLRTGFIGECRWGLLNDARKLDKSVLTRTVQRFVALGRSADALQPPVCPKPDLHIEPSNQHKVIQKFALKIDQPVLILCPGAEYGEAKRWPGAYYAEVARQKQEQGWQVWLLGSDKDRAVTEEINHLSQHVCLDFAGQTNLAEAIDLMSLATAVVSNDSGLMHVAAALNKKLVAIYGSSDPGFTPPLNDQAEILSLNLSCSPCFKRECPLSHLNCLREIHPGQVLSQLDHLCAF